MITAQKLFYLKLWCGTAHSIYVYIYIQKQWVDCGPYRAQGKLAREDLQFAELSITWWRKSQDRAGWRAAIECLLQST